MLCYGNIRRHPSKRANIERYLHDYSLDFIVHFKSLRKHVYSNIENFTTKN